MNTETAVRRAMGTLRLSRRSFRGACSAKGYGKKAAHKAERRVSKALTREGV